MRRWLSCTAVGLAMLLLPDVALSQAAAAPASRPPWIEIAYKGRSSQGRAVRLSVIKFKHGRRVVNLDTRLDLMCEDGTPIEGRVTVGVFFLPLEDDGSLHFEEPVQPGDTSILNVDGQVSFGHAEGTLTFTYAALTAEGEPQLCSTGDLTWEVERRGLQKGQTPRHVSRHARAVVRRSGQIVARFGGA